MFPALNDIGDPIPRLLALSIAVQLERLSDFPCRIAGSLPVPSSPKSSKHFYPFSLCRYPHSHTQFHAPCAIWGSAIVWSTRAKCLLDKQNQRKDLMWRDLSKKFLAVFPCTRTEPWPVQLVSRSWKGGLRCPDRRVPPKEEAVCKSTDS